MGSGGGRCRFCDLGGVRLFDTQRFFLYGSSLILSGDLLRHYLPLEPLEGEVFILQVFGM